MVEENNSSSGGNGKQKSLDKVLDNLQNSVADMNPMGSVGSENLQMKNYGSIQSMVNAEMGEAGDQTDNQRMPDIQVTSTFPTPNLQSFNSVSDALKA